MKKIISTTFTLVALVTSIATAQRAEKLQSWDDFKQIVQDNKVTNVDELLSHLPSNYIDSFTLMHRTRALHQESVTPTRPRVIMFGQGGKFIMTYNSHKSGGLAQPGDVESVETLSFDEKTGKSYLREVFFKGSIPDLKKVGVNPQRCLSCHTQSSKGVFAASGLNVKGLWDPYNSWSGAYGSLSRQGIDFIKLDTPEHINFQQFLAERNDNPRYSFLPIKTDLMSQLPATAFTRGFDPVKANDALTITTGKSLLPNQMLGMQLADQNFKRIGSILANQSAEKRAAFQYLLKGFSLDENFIKADSGDNTNATDLGKKVPACLAKIDSFLPTSMKKIKFKDFGDILLKKLRADYAIRKALVGIDNTGLLKLSPAFDAADPYDENREARGLEFDSINPATKFHLNPKNPGLTGNAALFYALYLMDIPNEDISTAITRGTNFKVDNTYTLSGSTNLYYGNTVRCYNGDLNKSQEEPYNNKKVCSSEGVEEFFTQYLPSRFYENQGVAMEANLNGLSCDELAAKSQEALTKYFSK